MPLESVIAGMPGVIAEIRSHEVDTASHRVGGGRTSVAVARRSPRRGRRTRASFNPA